MRTVDDVVAWLDEEARGLVHAAVDAVKAGRADEAAAALRTAETLEWVVRGLRERMGRDEDGMARTSTTAPGADYMATVATRLAALGVSRGALARKSGLAVTQISRWFNGHHAPSLANIRRLEDALAALEAEADA